MIKFKKRFENLQFANLSNSKELAEKYGHDFIIKLNYNENKFGASPKVKEAIKIQSPNIYPEYKSPLASAKLAELYGLTPDHFYISNGSDAILDYIPTLFASKTEGNNVVVPELTYGRISQTAKINDIEVKLVELVNDKIDLNKTLDAIDDKTAIVYIVNPNMPHGTYNSQEAIKEFIRKVPDHVLVVIDQAYAEYSQGVKQSFKDAKELVEEFDNLIITRTMSKMFGLASFRVGYAVGRPYLMDLFKKTAQCLPINKYSLQAQIAALSDLEYYEDVREKTRVQRERLFNAFDEMNIDYVPSTTNYILIKIKNPSDVREYILVHQGIMIRQVRDWGMRLTVGTPDEVDKVIEGFKGYINAQG